MSREYGLEGGYRRLSRAYPASHRGQHGEEMLGVLMASARPGQHQPRLADSANLLWGAVRIRVRASLDGESAPLWRDTLAVVSVIVPVLLLLKSVTQLIIRWIEAGLASPFQIMLQHPRGLIVPGTQLYVPTSPAASGAVLLLREIIGIAPLLILAVLVLLRLRRAATVATAVLLVYLPVSMVVASFDHSYVAPADWVVLSALGLLTALALEIAALLTSPGPRRGMEILTWKGFALVAVAAAAMGMAASSGWWLPGVQGWQLRELPLAAVVAVLTIGMALFSPLSRRIMIVLAVPVFYLLIGQLVPGMGPVSATLAYLPLVLLGLAAIAVARNRRTISSGGEHA